MPDDANTVALTAQSASANAASGLRSISVLTGAATLEIAFGIAIAPDKLTEGLEKFATWLLLGAVVCIVIAIYLAALASARAPIKAFFTNRALGDTTNQLLLQDIREKMVWSQRFAGLASMLFVFALGISLFGDAG